MTLWTVARLAPLSMEFSRHENWDQTQVFFTAGRFLPFEPPGKPSNIEEKVIMAKC